MEAALKAAFLFAYFWADDTIILLDV